MGYFRLAAVNRNLGKVTEWIRGYEIIRNNHAVDYFLSRFAVDSADLRDKKVHYALIYSLTQSISKFCTEISLIGSLAYSGYLTVQGVIDAGQFMTSVGIIEELKGHVIYVTGYIQSILVLEIPFGRMQEIIQEQETDEQLFQEMKRIGLDAYAKKECLDEKLTHAEQRFSGGEAKRLALIRALLKPSEILILYEPLANVDLESMHSICEVIFDEKDRFVLMISHQEPILRPGDHLQAIWEMSR